MKRVKQIEMALIALLMCFASCSSEDDGGKQETPKAPIEDFNQGNMTFTEGSDSKNFTFTANQAWTLTVAATSGETDWCTVSQSSGGVGVQNITVNVKANEGYEERRVTVTLNAGTESKSFVVSQKQKDAILLSSNKFEVSQNGGTITVEIKANVNYTAKIADDCKDWITESSLRSMTTTTKNYTIAMNEGSSKREGSITFSNGTLTETVHVYQAGGNIILLTEDEVLVDAAGKTITVELKSNCEYEVVMPSVNWITEGQLRAMSSHSHSYTIAANTGYDSRSAKIIYRDKKKSVADTLTITQGQKDAIVLSAKSVTVKGAGETIKVKLSANVDYDVTMPKVDWIKAVETRAMKEYTLSYQVEANKEISSRSAQITYSNKTSGAKDVLTIVQKGNIPTAEVEIHVANPGDLPKMTDRRDFKSLKLTGRLNKDDMKAIYSMYHLEFLDLSEAEIVEKEIKGTFSGHSELKAILLPKKITTIGDYAFSNCKSLTSINIPNGVTSIEDGAFQYCENLTSINIPNGVTTIGKKAFYDCKSLTSIDIPNGVTTIGDSTFYGCYKLTSVTIPNSVKTIGYQAFWCCSSLKTVNIPNGVTTIGDKAFGGCSSLTSIEISNSVKNIGPSTFFDCTSLTSIEIPNGVININYQAFWDCIYEA